MKIIKIAIPIAIIAFLGAYFISPYAAASGFTDSLKSYDAQGASQYIDYPRVRQGIKDDMNAEIAQLTLDNAQDNPFAAAGAAFAGSIVTGLIDATITPAGLEKMLDRASKDPAKEEPRFEYETEYDGLDRFLITITHNAKGEALEDPLTLTFERNGLFDWKLVDVDLPLDGLQDNLAGRNDNAGGNEPDAPTPEPAPMTMSTPLQEEIVPENEQDYDDVGGYEQPGFFYDVDEEGRPVETDENGEPIPSEPPR